MELLRSPYAHARIRSIDASRAPGAARRRRRGDGRGARRPRAGVDADAVRRHPGRPGHRQGALPGPGGRGGRRRDRLCREGRARADRRRLRSPRRGVDTAAGAGRRRTADPRRQGRPDLEPHLPLGGGRQGGDRASVRRGRQGRRARDVLPALPPRSARVLRLRRRRESGDRQGDDLHDVAGAPRAPDAVRDCRRPARAPDPDHLARHRRRLRQQGADLPRLRLRHCGVAPHRPPGEVDRGSHRQPDLDRLRPRLPHARRARAQGTAG